MIVQLVLIWAIVGATLVWFVRDERRQAHEKLDRAARYYATAPQYRHVTVEADPLPALPSRTTGGLTRAQRKYFDSFTGTR